MKPMYVPLRLELLKPEEEFKFSYLCFSPFIVALFPEDVRSDKRGRPTTASSKIKVRSEINLPITPTHLFELGRMPLVDDSSVKH